MSDGLVSTVPVGQRHDDRTVGIARATARIAPALRAVADAHAADLARLKTDAAKEYAALLAHDDGLWHLLLVSFSTLGDSTGYDRLVGNRTNYDRARFQAIAACPADQRLAHIERVLRDARVRYPGNKARYLLYNFDWMVRNGGPRAVRDRLLATPGRPAKLAFVRQFAGIGAKYARNLFMDLYHPDFHDSIAIDSRIAGVTAALGLSFERYEDHEAFYLEAGRLAGLNGWEVDRLLYNYRDEALAQL